MIHPRSRRTLLLLATALGAAATRSVRPDSSAVARAAEKDNAGARAASLEVYKV
jgi:hypothetical protein